MSSEQEMPPRLIDLARGAIYCVGEPVLGQAADLLVDPLTNARDVRLYAIQPARAVRAVGEMP